jgi:hypothetical protein
MNLLIQPSSPQLRKFPRCRLRLPIYQAQLPPQPATSPSPRTLSFLVPRPHIDLSSAEQARGNAAPLKSFMHEVSRRSRTSCSILQTALYYIEALRSKVPDLVHQEQTGEGIRDKVDQGSRVFPPDDLRLQEPPKEVDIDEVIDPVHFSSSDSRFSDDAPPTVRMLDDNLLAMPDVAP